MPTKAQKRRKKQQIKAKSASVVMMPRAALEAIPEVAEPVVSALPAEPAQEGFQKRTQIEITVCVLLAIITFAVYFRSTKNPFVNYDDQGYIIENSHVQQGLTKDTFRWALTSMYATNWHPLTWLSHALDCQLFGLNASGHHLTSLLLHVISTILIFLLLARATGATIRSALVAALFALHPINVESVAWIAERKNVLCMVFFLLTIAAYGWYARRPRIERYLAVVFFFALALAAKPMAVTLPFALLLLDFWPLYRVESMTPPEGSIAVVQAPFGRLVLEKVPLLVLSIASSVVTMIAQKPAVATNEHVPLLARFVNACYAYTMYVVKTFLPVNFASFYPYEGYRLAIWKFLLCAVFLVGTTVWVWKNRSRTYLLLGWLWFLGTLIPMIGLVQVGDQAMADRYAYLPLLGIFVMAVWGAAELTERWQLNLRWIGALAVLVLGVFSFLTWHQIGFWKSSNNLWFHALAVTKDNYMAEDYAGSALLVESYEATRQRHLDEALVHFQNAVRINPNDAVGHLNLGADLHERGQLQEAIEQYQMVIHLTNDAHLLSKALLDIGAATQQLKQYSVSAQYYKQAQRLEPNSEALMINLGRLGMAKRIDELTSEALAKPSPKAYLELGQLQQAAGQNSEARQSFETAIKLNPKFAEARKALDSLSAAATP